MKNTPYTGLTKRLTQLTDEKILVRWAQIIIQLLEPNTDNVKENKIPYKIRVTNDHLQ